MNTAFWSGTIFGSIISSVTLLAIASFGPQDRPTFTSEINTANLVCETFEGLDSVRATEQRKTITLHVSCNNGTILEVK